MFKKRFEYKLESNVISKFSKYDLKEIYKKLDLLIIDIDDTIAPHLTVGLSNEIFKQLFIKTFIKDCNKKEKRILTTKQTIKEIVKLIFNNKIKLSKDINNYKKLLYLNFQGIKLYLVKYYNAFYCRPPHPL